MILGAITNSWAQQLMDTDLPRLVERARRRGAQHIELRQSYLGQYETGAGDDWRPVTEKMVRLVRTFPLLTFNLAIAYPCLTTPGEPQSPVFQASLEAAKALGASGNPRLRMVDPARFDSPWESADHLPQDALGVADLARESARQGVSLFIENSGQPIRSMALLVREARAKLAPEEAGYLGLCVDAANSLRCDPPSDPVAEMEGLPGDAVLMVHFKQTRDGRPHPSVEEGDLDFRRQVGVMKAKGYDGPVVLEIPPGQGVFDSFADSVRYLEGLEGS